MEFYERQNVRRKNTDKKKFESCYCCKQANVYLASQMVFCLSIFNTYN